MISNDTSKLDKNDVEDILALSPMQEGLLFHYVTEPNGEPYFEQLVVRLRGEALPEPFVMAWEAVAAANETLRAVFRWEKLDKPVQIVLKRFRPPVAFHDLTADTPAESEAKLRRFLARDKERGIDLAREPYRIALCKLGDDRHALVLTNHHILLDGWSTGIVLSEFMQAYRESAEGRTWVPAPKTGLKTFIRRVRTQDSAALEAYWRKELADIEAKTPIPADKRKKERAGSVRSVDLALSDELSERLAEAARELHCTPAVVLYGAWAILLHKYGNTGDVLFGTTVSGRMPDIPGIDRMVGLFINTLPLRVRLEEEGTVAGLLGQVNRSVLEREPYQTTPLADMKRFSGFVGKEKLFDSLVVIENYPLERALGDGGGDAGLRVEGHSIAESTDYPLALIATGLEPIALRLQYDDELFREETVRRMAAHLRRILEEMAEGTGRRVSAIRMLEAEEEARLRFEYNRSEKPYPAHRSVHELFEEQARLRPDAPALRAGGQTLSYAELNRRANRVARFLRGRGIGPDDLVGILAERSPEMIVGILGALKAGAAYVPIDPDYPAARIAYLLEHSRTRALLTGSCAGGDSGGQKEGDAGGHAEDDSAGHKEDDVAGHKEGDAAGHAGGDAGGDKEGDVARHAEDDAGGDKQGDVAGHAEGDTGAAGAGPTGAERFDIAAIMLDPSLEDGDLELSLDPERLMYVLYTSGSTGNPKGVMIKTHAFVNLLHWFATEFGIGPGDNVLLIAPSSFDLAQKNFYCTLIRGGTLTLFEPGPYDYNRMSDVIYRERITLLNCSPSAFYPLMDFNEDSGYVRLASLRQVFLGGEPILVNRLTGWLRSPRFRAEIVNTYGPTECTDIAAYHRLDPKRAEPGAPVPIGGPVPNTKLYVLDRSMNLLPEGLIGELYIGGVGLARGYYRSPSLTAERFVPSPFGEGELLYQTGDLVRWLPGGLLDYVGRTDYQVKIRGMRLELAEVEAALLRHPDVREAVVVDREGANGTKRLCAYVVGPRDDSLPEIREHAAGQLPDYMVPASFTALERLPLTPNGKIDKRALPEPRREKESDAASRRAGTETELRLVSIWEELLGVPNVGLDDPFFDIGGDSVLLFKLHSRIEKLYPNRIAIADLFAYPTVSRIAKRIEEAGGDSGAYRPAYVKLPADAFASARGRAPGQASVEFEAGEAVVEAASEFGRRSGAEAADVYLAMWMYLLSEYAESPRVEALAGRPDGRIARVGAEIRRTERIEELFRRTGERRRNAREAYLPEKIAQGRAAEPSGNGILPLFVWAEDSHAAFAREDVFDLVLEASPDHRSVRIGLRFDPNRLRPETVNELADGYAELLAQLAQQFGKVGVVGE